MTGHTIVGREAFTGCVAVFLGVFTACLSIGPSVSAEDGMITTHRTERIFVHRLTPLADGGTSVEWAPVSNRILYDRHGVSQFYHVYSISPEGFRLRCVTLSKDRGAARLHNGTPSWHPSGDYIVFAAQNAGTTAYRQSLPGIGMNSNIWFGDIDGRRFWQLTSIASTRANQRGAAYPRFSADGSKLSWSGNTGETGGNGIWGKRALHMADFRFDGTRPALENVQTLRPGEQQDFYENYGFSPDGGTLLFAGNLGRAQAVTGMDIYALDWRDQTLRNLTDSPNSWDQHAAYSPDGAKIVWMSSAGQAIPYFGAGGVQWQRFLRSELWIMNADGSAPKQLTFFNTPGAAEHFGRRCFVGNSAWSPDGNRLAITLHYETRNFDVETKIVLIDLGLDPPEAPIGSAWSEER